MYGECNNCSRKSMAFDHSVDLGKQNTWYSWETKSVEKEKTVDGKAVSKKVNSGSLQVLLDEINRDLPRVAKHTWNEVMVHIDFSENYNCKYGSEIQSMRFGSSK